MTETQDEMVNICLPDLEETQIWENENETREVILYLETRNAKVSGTEFAPFVLPHRWTFQTLQQCIKDYVQNRLGHSEKEITQMYYKRAGKSRSVVAINSDQDIPALLKEYPTMTSNGRSRGRRAIMIMAVDLLDIPRTSSTPPRNTLLQLIGLDTPLRRSPRLVDKNKKQAGSSTLTAATAEPCMDAFLFEVTRSNNGEPKLSKTSSVMHNLPINSSLSELKKLVRAHESSNVVYIPVSGLYWIRKGTKAMVQLESEADFNYCKEEYKDSRKNMPSSIRIACATMKPDCAGTATKTRPPKRSLAYHGSPQTEEDAKELELVESVIKSKEAKKSANDLWNDTHCDLVRDLEKKGTLTRYSTRHLKLWADQITEGKSAGIGDEPQWEHFIDLIGVPPKQGREKSFTKSPDNSRDQLLKAMLIQSQRSTEVFQNSLLAILSNQQGRMQSPMHFSPHPYMCSTPEAAPLTSPPYPCMHSPEVKERKKLTSYTLEDCIEFLEANDLAAFIPKFVESEVDGPLLASLCHLSLGYSIFEGMGISKTDGDLIVNAVKSEMALSK